MLLEDVGIRSHNTLSKIGFEVPYTSISGTTDSPSLLKPVKARDYSPCICKSTYVGGIF